MARTQTSRRARRRARPGRAAARERVARAAVAAMVVTVTAAPHLLGGAAPWAVGPITFASAVVAGLAFWAARRSDVAERPAPVALAILLGVGITFLQTLPLPMELVRALAPETVTHVEHARALLEQPTAGPVALSRDPGATRQMFVHGLGVLAAFSGAWLLCVEGFRRWVVGAVAGSTLLIALVTLAHVAFGLDEVYGVYAPVYAEPELMSPLLNSNHLSGFLSMGVPVILGLALRQADAGRRYLGICLAVLVGATALSCLSRGGAAALLGGVVVFGVMALAMRRRRGRGRGGWAATAGLAAGSFAVAAGAAWTVAGPIIDEIGKGNTNKLDLARAAAEFSLRDPWLGVGRGAFSAAFATVAQGEGRAVHAENFVAEWMVELGLPATALIVGVFAYAVARALRDLRSVERLGAAVGVLVIAAQNLVDFGLELPGIGVVAATLFAAAVAPRPERDSPPPRHLRRLHMLRITPLVAVAGLVSAALVGPILQRDSLEGVRAELEAATGPGARPRFRATLERAVELHPAEPVVPLLAGAEAVLHDDPSAMRWLGRAMHLAPFWAAPHVQAARFLARAGHSDQALLEIREAATLAPRAPVDLACAMLELRPDAALLLRAAPPSEPHRAEFLEAAVRCLRDHPEQVERVDRAMLESDPSLVMPRARIATRRTQAGDPEAALEMLEPIVRAGTHRADVWTAWARAMIAVGRPSEVPPRLLDVERSADEPARVIEARARAAAAAGDPLGASEAVDALRGLAGGSARHLARAAALEAALARRMGNHAESLAHLQEARRLEPTPERIEQVARQAEALGAAAVAADAWRELCALRPDHPRACRGGRGESGGRSEQRTVGEGDDLTGNQR